MLWGGHTGGLEARRSADGVTVLSGRFPYGVSTVLWDGGSTGQARKEEIASRAFAARIEAGDEIHFLSGHDHEKPIASRSAGTLSLTDGDDALSFEARIAPDMAGVTWVRDLLSAVTAGLVRGISPGFRLSRNEGAEIIRTEPGAIVRTVKAADLIEISAVTRPAYPQAQIEARSWVTEGDAESAFPLPANAGLHRTLQRWRA